MKQSNLKSIVFALFSTMLFLAVSNDAEAASKYGAKGKDIGNFMNALHKGKNSYATLAKQGKLNSRQLSQLAGNYRLMMNLTPNKNKAQWRASVAALVNATSKLARNPKDPKLIAGYSRASDCNSCHRKHR